MLIQKTNTLEEGKPIILRLATGDEVACQVKRVSESEVTITHAFRLAVMQQGVGFVPFSLLTDPSHDITINKTQIVAYYQLNNDVEKDYLSASSGIQL